MRARDESSGKVRTVTFEVIDEEEDGGYSARAVDAAIFTQGETLEELRENMVEAAVCHYGRKRRIDVAMLFEAS